MMTTCNVFLLKKKCFLLQTIVIQDHDGGGKVTETIRGGSNYRARKKEKEEGEADGGILFQTDALSSLSQSEGICLTSIKAWN